MKHKFGKKINLYCPPLTGLKVRWNFTTIYSQLRDPFAQPLKKGRGNLSIERKNRMVGICFAHQHMRRNGWRRNGEDEMAELIYVKNCYF